MSAASEGRPWLRAALWLGVASAYSACGFPEHTFIPDDEFEGVSGAANAAGRGGALGTGSGGSSAARGAGGSAATVDAGSDVSAGGAGSGGTAAVSGAGGKSGADGAVGAVGGGAGGAAGTAAGGAAAGGAAGTGGAAGSAGKAGSGGGPTEVCSNGSDDDDDTKIDCADEDCTALGFQCAVKPSDWSGPVALQTGPTADNPPSCSGEYPTVSANLNRFLNSPDASCTACGCGSPAGATCTTPVIGLWTNGTCSSSIGWFNLTTVAAPTCRTYTLQVPDGGVIAPASARIQTPSMSSGGSCQQSGGSVVNLPALTWNERGRACGERSGGSLARGCGTDLCVAPAAGGFNHGVCIFKPGDNACPGTAFANKVVLYGGLTDSRSCAACGCDAPTGIQCRGTVSVYEAGCSTMLGSLFSVTDCIPVTPTLSKAFRFNPTAGDPQGGSCAATGGGPSGSATPQNPTTYCCL